MLENLLIISMTLFIVLCIVLIYNSYKPIVRKILKNRKNYKNNKLKINYNDEIQCQSFCASLTKENMKKLFEIEGKYID